MLWQLISGQQGTFCLITAACYKPSVAVTFSMHSTIALLHCFLSCAKWLMFIVLSPCQSTIFPSLVFQFFDLTNGTNTKFLGCCNNNKNKIVIIPQV